MSEAKYRVLIVDDQALYRGGLGDSWSTIRVSPSSPSQPMAMKHWPRRPSIVRTWRW